MAKPRKDLKLWKYNISTDRYRQLLYFCRQYPEWKAKTSYGLKAVNNDGMPRGNNISNPTEAQAIQNEKWLNNINLLETTAQEADSFIWKSILNNVAYGIVYEYLDAHCGRRQFYDSRRKFFYMLDLKLP